MITLAGVIGSGKSSLTRILADELHTTPFFEPVADNPVLPLFYKGNEQAAKARANGNPDASNPYTYLLQTFFINRRFAMIKKAIQGRNNILDRSILEDEMFMKMNTDMGNATHLEFSVYEELLHNMLAELDAMKPTNTHDLLIYIRVSYDTMIHRIEKRGRDYEQISTDPSLVEYYHTLLQYYADWEKNYNRSAMMVIDGDQYDFVERPADRNLLLDQIEQQLVDLGTLSSQEFADLHQHRQI